MSGPRIKLSQGEIEGKIHSTPGGIQYSCFKGIPFGKPPVGELRFKDPLPADKWTGIRDGTEEGNVCPQVDVFGTGSISGNEDCLYLNVYTPQQSTQSSVLPVMVWVHGGGFYKGSGNYAQYGPDFILEKNVVYVSINYRFSVFGFFCLNTPEVPGNAGLKDQVLALQWIQQNIEVFGGDPNNVTVFGESAGAASIHYLSLSPIARGLFHKAIIQSGSAFCQWALQPDPLKYALKLAESLGCQQSDPDDILTFLQKIPTDELLSHASKILSVDDSKRYFPVPFIPVIEKKIDGVKSIITDNPEDIIKSGNFESVPIIAGYSSRESVFMFEKISCDVKRLFEMINDFQYFIPLKLNLIKDTENALSVAKEIKRFYFKENDVCPDTLNGVIDLVSDFLFRHAVDLTVKLLAEHSTSPIYYFQFSYLGNLSRDKLTMAKLMVKGASHSEENGYIFRKQYLDNETVSPKDEFIRQSLVKMWTNFAKYGEPIPKNSDIVDTIWKPVTTNNINYLEIGENLVPGNDPNSEALRFWIHLRNKID